MKIIIIGLSIFLIPLSVFSKSKQIYVLQEKDKINLQKQLREKGLSLGANAFVRIIKKPNFEPDGKFRANLYEAKLELWFADENGRYKLFKKYDACTYSGGLGPKTKQGDFQLPEGFYAIDAKQFMPAIKPSKYDLHMAMDIGYPNEFDRANRRNKEKLGGDIWIHGDCMSSGCLAMGKDKRQIEEIYYLLDAARQNGQNKIPVHIFPFPMQEEYLQHYLADKNLKRWKNFWYSLKSGYDYFERHKIPPKVAVTAKQYVVDDTLLSEVVTDVPTISITQ